jgi:hypothetical protein
MCERIPKTPINTPRCGEYFSSAEEKTVKKLNVKTVFIYRNLLMNLYAVLVTTQARQLHDKPNVCLRICRPTAYTIMAIFVS